MKIYFSVMILVTSTILAGCTIAMYPGSERPLNEVAQITSRNTYIATVDGNKVPYNFFKDAKFSKILVLPGKHELGVILAQEDGYIRNYSPIPVNVSFIAKASHVYEVFPTTTDKFWRPKIVDLALRYSIDPKKLIVLVHAYGHSIDVEFNGHPFQNVKDGGSILSLIGPKKLNEKLTQGHFLIKGKNHFKFTVKQGNNSEKRSSEIIVKWPGSKKSLYYVKPKKSETKVYTFSFEY
jgi:hypothetical protein